MMPFGLQEENEQDHDQESQATEQPHSDDNAHDQADGGQHQEGEGAHAHEGDGHGHHEADFSNIAGRKEFFLDPAHLISHVQDQTFFEFPSGAGHEPVHLNIPNPLGYTREKPAVKAPEGLEQYIGPITWAPTKFVVLELIAALLVAAVFIPYARRIKNGDRPQGKFWQLVDSVVCYVKDQIAVPAIGKSDAKRFLPLLWSLFFFILFLNLFGMIPGIGAATGSITITIALALIVFVVVVGSGSQKMGVVGFWKAQVPHMDLPFGMGYILKPMIWLIEVFGLLVKHVVLAVRLFANMFAGHLVVAVFVALVGVLGTYLSGFLVGPPVLAISLLELLVAFIQAYVFTFLAALFIGAAVHPH